nr:kinesin-like protein KIN-12D [Ipomoea batatas]
MALSKLEMAQVLAEENEAVALEAKELAEIRKLYAEEKEEEVKLLERSIEELALSKKKLSGNGYKERNLEMELHNVKQQMLGVKSSNADVKRNLDEKEKNLLEASQRIQILEKERALRDAEFKGTGSHKEKVHYYEDENTPTGTCAVCVVDGERIIIDWVSVLLNTFIAFYGIDVLTRYGFMLFFREKGAELAAARDNEQDKVLEESLKEAEKEVHLLKGTKPFKI